MVLKIVFTTWSQNMEYQMLFDQSGRIRDRISKCQNYSLTTLKVSFKITVFSYISFLKKVLNKANRNVGLICKSFYIKVLKKEPGIGPESVSSKSDAQNTHEINNQVIINLHYLNNCICQAYIVSPSSIKIQRKLDSTKHLRYPH